MPSLFVGVRIVEGAGLFCFFEFRFMGVQMGRLEISLFIDSTPLLLV